MKADFPTVPLVSDASIVRRGVSRPAPGVFSSSLAAASVKLHDEQRGANGTGAGINAVARYLRNSAALQDSRSPRAGSSARESTAASQVQPRVPARVVGPFGETGHPGSVVTVNAESGPAAEWKAYFATHAPGQWWFNAIARTHFAEIYGAAALTTLDWTGTVPENIDPNFVTRVPVDGSGKPIPKSAWT